uniref:Uncharacterized protein n=1 Tax=Oryza brachyantha TaxID=4533 RepID=J3LRZ5_ORYBR
MHDASSTQQSRRPESGTSEARQMAEQDVGRSGCFTLGAGKEMDELRPRAERGREEVAMGTDTMERVAISALPTRRVRCVRFSPELFLASSRIGGEADKVGGGRVPACWAGRLSWASQGKAQTGQVAAQ